MTDDIGLIGRRGATQLARDFWRHPDTAVPLLLAVFTLLVRLPFITTTGVRNVDELDLGMSVVDRWLNLPAINLAWPAVPQQLFAFVAMAPKVLILLLSDRSLLSASQAIFAHYEDPSLVIGALRLASTLAAVASVVALYRLGRLFLSDPWTCGELAFAITCVPMFFQLSVSGTADITSFAFCAWAAFYALKPSPRPILVGILAAAAASSKIGLGIWLIPLFVQAAVSVASRVGLRAVAVSVAAVAASGLASWVLFDPYLWLAPLNYLKALGGNVLAHAGTGDLPEFEFLTFVIPATSVLTLLAAVASTATAIAFRANRSRSVLVLGVILVASLGWFAKAGFSYPRYILGATMSLTVLIAAAAEPVPRRLSVLVFGVVAILLLAASFLDQGRFRPGSVNDVLDFAQEACAKGDQVWLQDSIVQLNGARLALPKSTISEIVTYLENADTSPAVRDWIAAAKVAPAAVAALMTNFNSREQVQLARWRGLLALNPNRASCAMHLFRFPPEGVASKSESGYVRGTLSSRSIQFVKTAFDGSGGRFHVIGAPEALDVIGQPMRPLGGGWRIVSKGQ